MKFVEEILDYFLYHHLFGTPTTIGDPACFIPRRLMPITLAVLHPHGQIIADFCFVTISKNNYVCQLYLPIFRFWMDTITRQNNRNISQHSLPRHNLVMESIIFSLFLNQLQKWTRYINLHQVLGINKKTWFSRGIGSLDVSFRCP